MARLVPAQSQLAPNDPADNLQLIRPGLGTLLWIGSRKSTYFRDAYEFCDGSVAQLAYRTNTADALQRPAAGVNVVLLCCENDSTMQRSSFRQLCLKHAQAETILLLGPLCAGCRPHPSELFQTPAVYWHEWEAYLPAQLIRCGHAVSTTRLPSSIAVVSSSHANGTSLLAIASSSRSPAVLLRPEQVTHAENISQYWWDDSATQSGSWQDRISRCRSRTAEHIWITGMLSVKAKQQAQRAGVGLILSKPGNLTPLFSRIAGIQTQTHRHAA